MPFFVSAVLLSNFHAAINCPHLTKLPAKLSTQLLLLLPLSCHGWSLNRCQSTTPSIQLSNLSAPVRRLISLHPSSIFPILRLFVAWTAFAQEKGKWTLQVQSHESNSRVTDNEQLAFLATRSISTLALMAVGVRGESWLQVLWCDAKWKDVLWQQEQYRPQCETLFAFPFRGTRGDRLKRSIYVVHNCSLLGGVRGCRHLEDNYLIVIRFLRH